jgi:tripartite-type tricarboxylate transporter receptor subunit TctC
LRPPAKLQGKIRACPFFSLEFRFFRISSAWFFRAGWQLHRFLHAAAPADLQEKLGQGIAITNTPGASGSAAAINCLAQKADGYTLFFASETASLWETMGTAEVSYEDFIPIKLVASAVPVIAVPPDSKFKTAEEFLVYAQEHPGELRIGTAGPATVPHISGIILENVLGCKFTYVPFQGGQKAITAVMGSQVDATIEMVQGMVSSYEEGKLKILASLSNEPIKGYEIPALGQIKPELSQYFPYGPYFGLFAPEGTPQEVIDKLKAAMDQAVADPEWKAYTDKLLMPRMDYSDLAAMNFLKTWTSKAAYLLYDNNAARNDPAKLGIERPAKK